MTRKEIIIALAAYGEATSPDTSIAHTAILISALDRPTLPLGALSSPPRDVVEKSWRFCAHQQWARSRCINARLLYSK